MQVVVIFMRYLDPGGQQQTVGGVETYIEQLGLLAAELAAQSVLVRFTTDKGGWESESMSNGFQSGTTKILWRRIVVNPA
jgi:hypothetical protein